VPSARIAGRLRQDELRLIRALQASGENDGVIGRISGASLHRFPSNLYWIGMQRWGILRYPGTQAQYQRSLDAAFFHLYLPAGQHDGWIPAPRADGCPYDETDEQLAELKRHFPTPRHAVDYILDTFPIVRRKDEQKYGEYRTKRVILEIYDEMQQAIATGKPYQTRLNPPAGRSEVGAWGLNRLVLGTGLIALKPPNWLSRFGLFQNLERTMVNGNIE